MERHSAFIILILLLVIGIGGCGEEQSPIESISIDYPHGESRLLVERSGKAFLFYGALPSYEEVRSGTFDTKSLYKQLETRLHDNVPREEWPNPQATAGMVIIDYEDQSQEDYLIFDEQYAEQLFKVARENILNGD